MNFGFHVVNVLPPLADQYAGTQDTDIVDAGAGEGVLFVIQNGAVSGAAVSTITVEASDDVSASNVATVPFVYRTNLATDVWSDWTAATTAGFSAAMGANTMFQVYVDSAEIAEEGYQFTRLSTDETGNFTVLSGVVAYIMNPRFALQPDSVLA